MAEVVLFHHAQGLTPGIVAFADELRRAGHTVHTPDVFEVAPSIHWSRACGSSRNVALAR